MPRKSNHGTATKEDLIILWAMLKKIQIHWPYLMAYKLVNYSNDKDKGVPNDTLGCVTGGIREGCSQAPQEAGETSQAQPSFMEILLKGFEGIHTKMDEGFARLSDRIDSLDISLISQGEEIRMLRDEFHGSKGKV
ncbi:hypothetical protein PIB30_058349 [Stylosanthes scabra]|uniref:Uncharacterized protein n=1 Tax=Stylosanthes scabra TaxID=79078 RepID=A0ABU6QJD0_9FABA|nr:hypothetical protein [Stylosanthes scabra]